MSKRKRSELPNLVLIFLKSILSFLKIREYKFGYKFAKKAPRRPLTFPESNVKISECDLRDHVRIA